MKLINPITMFGALNSNVFYAGANLSIGAFNLGIALGLGSTLNLILGLILMVSAYIQFSNIYDERKENGTLQS